MSWQRSRPGGGKTAPKYRDPEHSRTRRALMTELKARGQGACAEVICVMPSRLITPDMELDLCHDPSGTVVLGLGHRKCNRTDASKRARARQEASRLRW